MTAWLLSGHNTQETTGVARPVTVTMTETGLDAQIAWFLGQLAGDTSDFDHTLKPTEVVQGRLYLNINYYARNMGSVVPFDPESVGVPAHLVETTAQVPRERLMRLPMRFRTTYRWAANFYRHELAGLDRKLRDIYWQLRKSPADPLPLIWPLFEPKTYTHMRESDRAHIVIALTITTLDGILHQRAPQLLNLFAGQETATSLIGQRIWELRQTADHCGPEVRQMLADGEVELEAYDAQPRQPRWRPVCGHSCRNMATAVFATRQISRPSACPTAPNTSCWPWPGSCRSTSPRMCGPRPPARSR